MSTQDWMPRSHELRHKLAVLIFTILIGRWENTRGQKGPFGEIQSVIIP
jgi:hypothetical protein